MAKIELKASQVLSSRRPRTPPDYHLLRRHTWVLP